MHKNSLIYLLGIPPIQIGRETVLVAPVLSVESLQRRRVWIDCLEPKRDAARFVVFDFVKPTWSEGRVSGSGREARLDEALAGSTQTKHWHTV
jgi:hypothetical protein